MLQFIFMEMRARDVEIFPQHEQVLSNFKAQVKNQVCFTSLKILCARKVVDFWPDYAKKGLTQLSSILPKTLCSLMYQEFLEPGKDKLNLTCMRPDWHEFNADLEEKLYLFAGDGLEELDCSILSVERKLTDCHQKIFEQLAKGSPKLRSLTDKNFYPGSCKQIQDKFLVFEYYSLKTMSSLVVLELNIYPVKEADLQVICLHLPLLRRLLLKFGSDINSIEELVVLTNLKFLEHLTLEVKDNDDPASVQLVKNCLQLMPQVNTVGTSLRDIFFVLHEFPLYECPKELRLEHLVLGKKSVIPSNVILPNVCKITVSKKLTVSLMQFKKLQEFSCLRLPWPQLEQTLSEVGHLLKKLKISCGTCDLTRVLHFCPTLEDLHLFAVKFSDNFHASQLKNCVQNLKSFVHDIGVTGDDTDEENIIDSRGLLHLLLTSSPDLEELTFSGIRLTKEEIDLITKSMEAGLLAIKLLQKVHIMAEVEKEAYVSFAEFACKMCEQNYKSFKKVYISEWLDRGEDVPELNLAQKMQYYINNKHRFRNNLNF